MGLGRGCVSKRQDLSIYHNRGQFNS